MQLLSRKFRASRWLWLLLLALMVSTTSGCALFEPEPEKIDNVQTFLKQPRVPKTKMDY